MSLIEPISDVRIKRLDVPTTLPLSCGAILAIEETVGARLTEREIAPDLAVVAAGARGGSPRPASKGLADAVSGCGALGLWGDVRRAGLGHQGVLGVSAHRKHAVIRAPGLVRSYRSRFDRTESTFGRCSGGGSGAADKVAGEGYTVGIC